MTKAEREARRKIRELERALKIIEQARRWIPSLVWAMRASGSYGVVWPNQTEKIADRRRITHLRGLLTREKACCANREKAAGLQKNKIYELKGFKRIWDGDKWAMEPWFMLFQLTSINKYSLRVKVLASDLSVASDGYDTIDLSEVSKLKEVGRDKLPLYVGRDTTVHFERLLKG